MKIYGWFRYWVVAAWVFHVGWVAAQAPCPPDLSTPTQAQVDAGAKAAKNRGYLWRISKEGRASYLYGSIHVAQFDWIFPGKEVYQALQATDVLALEINPLDENTLRELQQGMAADTHHALPKAVQARINRLASKNCVPSALLQPMRAEMQIATLAEMVARQQGLEPTYGIDLQLALLARAIGKPVEPLETVAIQLAALLEPDPVKRLRDTQDALTQLESGRDRASLMKVAAAWANSDFQTLSTYEAWCQCINTEAEKQAARRLLEERNPHMAKNLDALHSQGKKVFATVGALHMIGPRGLPALMAERGYVVQRVF